MGDIADLQKMSPPLLDNYKSGIAILDDLIRKAPTNRNWRDNLPIFSIRWPETKNATVT
jgi:hypothetical protein